MVKSALIVFFRFVEFNYWFNSDNKYYVLKINGLKLAMS